MNRARSSSFWSIWGIPIVLAALTTLGLLLALLGPISWRWISWLSLIVPIAVGVVFSLRRERR